MRLDVLFLSMAAAAGPAALAAQPALMPMPVLVRSGPGRFLINGNLVVDVVGGAGARLAPAVASFLARVSRQTGIPLSPQPPEPAVAQRLAIDCNGGPAYPTLGEDEAYTLDVSNDGVRIKAATAEGVIYALATFVQLIQPGPEGFQVSGVHIEDRPRFPWRGLVLDVSRHWMPVAVVKRTLDAMAAVKLNVFHWHLTDDQGFRVESKRYPKLQEMGSDGYFYTQEQVREIVSYARDRGIRVVPEFEMPAHTGSLFPGYPELASAPGPFLLGNRSGAVMDPSKESTYTFLDGLIGEMVQLFPDPYFHIGGDEVRAAAWEASPSIQAFAKEHGLANAAAIQVHFNQRLLKIVEKYGKTMVGWDEILVPGLPTDAVIQSWRGQKSLSEAASRGYRGILSWGYYLDHLRPASFHYSVDPLGGPDAAALTPEQAARILGGEACMWSELVNAETVDSRTWPRAAAIAERLWSPKDLTDVDSMYTRMAVTSRNLEWTGVRHRANYQPMLDRLAGDRPAGPLRILADASEALGLGTGRRGRPAVWMPVNRFVDACQPESELVRSLELAAGRFLANPAGDKDDAATLRRQFESWAANDAGFQQLAENNKLLTEIIPVSRDLTSLGTAGLRMLEYLEKGQAAPAEWLSRQSAELDRLSRPPAPMQTGRQQGARGQQPRAGATQEPSADVRLAAFRPVKMLADALSKK